MFYEVEVEDKPRVAWFMANRRQWVEGGWGMSNGY